MSNYESANSVNGPACAYAQLGRYNSPSGIAVPRSVVTGKYIVPDFSAPGYDTLTGRGNPSCTGYFNIQRAYGSADGACDQRYITSLCQ